MPERDPRFERLKALLAAALEDALPDAEKRELEAILRDDPEARRFYARHCQMQAMLTEETQILGLLEDGANPDNVVQLPLDPITGDDTDSSAESSGRAAAGVGATAASSAAATRLASWARPAAFGAVCAAAGVVAALYFGGTGHAPTTAEAPAPIADRPVELVREAELSDGSKVQLAPRSYVSLHYTGSTRSLELESGEAHFSVAHDEKRPFVVSAGNVRIRAVGTAFDVRRAGERVVVTVVEGRVQVYAANDSSAETSTEMQKGAPPVDAVIAAAGNQVLWDRDESRPGPVLASVNPSQVLSWRDGRLDYVREPLRAVVADLNRYSDRPVVLSDKALGRLRITGTVLTNSIADWLPTLSDSLPVRVEIEAGRYLILPTSPGGAAG